MPAAYGGFETLAEELSARLAARGHDVTVYARAHGVGAVVPAHRGARVVHLPTLRTKYLDTVVHAALSGLHAAAQGYDAVLVCNGANALLCRLPRLLGAPTRIVLNVDGLERNRRKWNALGKLVYALSERLSCVMPDAVVTDARAIETYYEETYGQESVYIPYGSDLAPPAGRAALERLGLAPGGYVLYVSRFEPENNADAVVQGVPPRAESDTKLVLVGAAPYADTFLAHYSGGGRRRPARPPARRALRRAVPRAPRERGRLRARDGSRRHAPRARRGDGVRPASRRPRHTREPRGGRGGRALRGRPPRGEPRRGRDGVLLSDPAARESSGRAARARARSLYLWDSVADAYEALLAGS